MSDESVSWDDYAAQHAITEQKAPQAFAAYLHEVSDGRWDGEVAASTMRTIQPRPTESGSGEEHGVARSLIGAG